MEYLPIVIIILLLAAVFCLLARLHFLHKDLDTVVKELGRKLRSDTNTPITTSSSDRTLRRLVTELNTELTAFRIQKLQLDNRKTQLQNAITNVAHDLRTPLTAICGYLTLMEQADASPEIQRYMEIVSERTQALKALTEELFRYSVTAAGQTLTLEIVDLVRALEEALAASYAVLKEAGIEPEIHLPNAPVMRLLDRAAVGRVFGNVLLNAAKYSAGDLTINLSPEGVIEFTNTAPTLDSIQVGRLFDRFYTVENAGSSTGLGLSIAKTLVEQMGGSIEAELDSSRIRIRVLFGISVEHRISASQTLRR